MRRRNKLVSEPGARETARARCTARFPQAKQDLATALREEKQASEVRESRVGPTVAVSVCARRGMAVHRSPVCWVYLASAFLGSGLGQRKIGGSET